MEPIRILQVFTILNRGGSETMIMNYYRSIDRSKIQFDFLVHRQEKGEYDDEIENMGGKIYRMLPIRPGNFAEYKKRLDGFFQQHKEYKIVHAHLNALSTFVLYAAKKHGVLVRIAHSHTTHYNWNLKVLFRECSRMLLNQQCTHRCACSEKAGSWLFGKKYTPEVIVLKNAIEAEAFRFKEESRRCVREILNLQDRYIIGHIGSFTKAKNHKFIIDIFYSIRKRVENAVLLLVGEGELKQEMIQKVETLGLKDSVMFLGYRGDVHEIMQAFDVFLFPSLFEGLPVAMIEAQAAGLPCVISDTIPAEVKITDLVEFNSLSKSSPYWAEQITKYKNGYHREDRSEEIVKSGYDIKDNAKWLEGFYLTEYSKNG